MLRVTVQEKLRLPCAPEKRILIPYSGAEKSVVQGAISTLADMKELPLFHVATVFVFMTTLYHIE